MSITDPTADDVQPQEGQGDAGTSDAPYAEYLNRIPEQLRGDVEPVFKEWDSNVGRKFQEAADYRKQWEPYEQTGLKDYDPDAVAWAMQFYEAHQNNPQAVVDYVKSYAEEKGIPFGAPQPEQAPETFDDFTGFQDPQQLQSMIDQAVGPFKQQLEQFQGWMERQEQVQEQAQVLAKLEGQVAQIEKKNGAPLDENQKAVLARFASHYDNADDAILRGWDDMQAFANQVEKSTLQTKINNPPPAEGGGIPDVNPTKYSRVDDPNVIAQAKEMLRNNRG